MDFYKEIGGHSVHRCMECKAWPKKATFWSEFDRLLEIIGEGE